MNTYAKRHQIIAVAWQIATIDKSNRQAQIELVVKKTGCLRDTAVKAIRDVVHELKMESYGNLSHYRQKPKKLIPK